MDLKYHDIICVYLWTYALQRQDEGVAGLIIIIWPCVNSHHVRIFASARAWYVWAWHTFEGVVSWCPLLGSEFVLESHVGSSAVRKREASASRRLCMYYNHAKSNP